jgi:hypothetical protein
MITSERSYMDGSKWPKIPDAIVVTVWIFSSVRRGRKQGDQ